MISLMRKLWADEGGFILSTEAMILWTITVLGVIVGLVAIRDATVVELTEVANTIVSFDQSFGYGGLQLTGGTIVDKATVNGSNAQDYPGIQAGATPSFYGVAAQGMPANIPAPNVPVVIHIPAP